MSSDRLARGTQMSSDPKTRGAQMSSQLRLLTSLAALALTSFVAGLALAAEPADAPVKLDDLRSALIVRAFNQSPNLLIELLTADSVKIKNGVGRVDVNKKAKFSYYIQTEDPSRADSKIFLIPMATSRFTPTYYQTDEWWDAHKDQKPMPRQPMQEVADWLSEMKLTSNPDVLVLKGISQSPRLSSAELERVPLNQFLLDHYMATHAKNGVITVYRGAERVGELEQWNKGQRPASVRYWTPTANYAWRYARKNPNFVPELLAGKAPLLKFEIPVADFKQMVLRRWPRLTLGTELTKKVHDSFDASGVFKDQLAGGADYLGEGSFGVEFEIRSNRAGADDMLKYYVGAISVQELASDRIRVIRQATQRLQLQRPLEALSLEAKADQRVQQIQLEAQVLSLLQARGERSEILALSQQIKRPELTAIDGFNLSTFIVRSAPVGADKVSPAAAPGLKLSAQKSCRAVLWQ